MASSHDSHDGDTDQLVARLTTGFGAMLQQVQDLASKNTELEQRLARIREEVINLHTILPRFSRFAMMLQNSSRSRVTNVTVIDNIPIILSIHAVFFLYPVAFRLR